MKLTTDDNYSAHDLQSLIRNGATDIFSKQKFTSAAYDFVSLGPGDGVNDLQILKCTQDHIKFANYYPFDISVELLQKSVSLSRRYCASRKINIKAIHGDFSNLRKYRPVFGYDDCPNVFSLVGFTLGNGNEAMLLGKIKEAMNEGDFLIVDARLHDIADAGTLKEIKMSGQNASLLINYNHQANNKFAFGPIEMVTTAKYKSESIGLEISKDYTTVDDAFNIVTYVEDLDTRLRSTNKSIKIKRLDLASTTLYKEESLSTFFEDKGFSIVGSHKNRGFKAILYLLEKRKV